MNKGMHRIAFARSGMWIALLCCAALTSIAFAGAKVYPIEGIVTILGTNQELIGGGSTPVITNLHRTYTVKTPTRVFVLECPYWMNGIHIYSPSECGGKKKIEVGNTIRLRVAKGYAYVQTDVGKEQKLKILSEGIKDEAAPESAKP